MKIKSLLILFTFLFVYAHAQDTLKIYSHPEWSYNKTIYEANIRQFSEEGTFNKFREYIPDLKKMGIRYCLVDADSSHR
jgi:cyclomaltodextrinase / maltogenic alpha-amylase / neopullulanase